MNKKARKKHIKTKKQAQLTEKKEFSFAKYQKFFWLVGILTATLAVYYKVLDFDFVNWDDDRYVIDNPYLSKFTWETVKIFFTDFYFLMYLPITMLTFLIDYQINGLDPSVFHATSLFFHLLNSALVFFFVYKLVENDDTKYKLHAAVVVSSLFALASLHVESTVWIAERKDVVYSAFYFITLLCYLKYLKQNSTGFLILAVVMFYISLISKAQAMPLPIILVLIDYLHKRDLLSKKVILEKVPFFILSIIFGIIAIIGTRSEGVSSNEEYSILERIVYAAYGFVSYIVKLFVPYKLSVIYPYPESAKHAIPLEYWLYLLPFLAIMAAFLYAVFKNKKIAFGIGFFSANIVIVLQIFAYHNFVMADRYSYVSSIGIFYLFAYGYILLLKNNPRIKYFLHIGFALYLAFTSFQTFTRLDDWENSISLWNDVRAKYPNVIIAYYNGGNAKAAIGDDYAAKNDKKNAQKFYDSAIADYEHAISLKGDYIEALSNRGVTLAKQGDAQKALLDFNKVAKLDSSFDNVYSNRGNAKIMLGDVPGAIKDYDMAIKINPSFTDAYFNRAMAKLNTGKWQEGYDDLVKLLELNPHFPNAHYKMGIALSQLNKKAEAIRYFNLALQQNPENLDAYYNRGITLYLSGKFQEAINDFSTIIGKNKSLPQPYFHRGIAKIKAGQTKEACKDLQEALKRGMKEAAIELSKYCK